MTRETIAAAGAATPSPSVHPLSPRPPMPSHTHPPAAFLLATQRAPVGAAGGVPGTAKFVADHDGADPGGYRQLAVVGTAGWQTVKRIDG